LGTPGIKFFGKSQIRVQNGIIAFHQREGIFGKGKILWKILVEFKPAKIKGSPPGFQPGGKRFPKARFVLF